MSRIGELACGTVVFLGAFLLFWIQPLFGQRLLSVFGGGSAIWSACLLFFQMALLIGYAYAHLYQQISSPSLRREGHLVLLVAACGTFAFTDTTVLSGEITNAPILQIVLLMAVSIGVPFVVLSSTGPLVQSWYAAACPNKSPYRLYALSNIGALLALIGYLVVLEPQFSLKQQLWAWEGVFVVFALLYAALSLKAANHHSQRRLPNEVVADLQQSPPAYPTIATRLAWILLPAMSSIALSATTNHLCQDLAPLPLLWAVPLALFLLSFILAFEHPRWYRRGIVSCLTIVSLYLAVGFDNPHGWATARWSNELRGFIFDAHLTAWRPEVPTIWRIGVHSLALFATCWMLHGELYRARPATERLTQYYLAIASGGAIGGVLVNFVAPQLFATYFEWKLSLVAAYLLAMTCAFLVQGSTNTAMSGVTAIGSLRAAGLIVSGFALFEMHGLMSPSTSLAQSVVKRSRTFYGTLSVVERPTEDGQGTERLLFHGNTAHGMQFADSYRQDWPTTYYSRTSGAGRVLSSLANRTQLRVGVVGMGVGSLATYASAGHSVRFYEIDPQVIEIAEADFTFTSRARQRGVEISTVVGDARQSLLKEHLQQDVLLDVLILDAFSGDSIPAHLLTREAFQLYFDRLAHNGTVAVHVSNRSLNLAAVVARISEEVGIEPILIEQDAYPPSGVAQSKWIVMTLDDAMPQRLGSLGASQFAPMPLWTDDHHSAWTALQL